MTEEVTTCVINSIEINIFLLTPFSVYQHIQNQQFFFTQSDPVKTTNYLDDFGLSVIACNDLQNGQQ